MTNWQHYASRIADKLLGDTMKPLQEAGEQMYYSSVHVLRSVGVIRDRRYSEVYYRNYLQSDYFQPDWTAIHFAGDEAGFISSQAGFPEDYYRELHQISAPLVPEHFESQGLSGLLELCQEKFGDRITLREFDQLVMSREGETRTGSLRLYTTLYPPVARLRNLLFRRDLPPLIEFPSNQETLENYDLFARASGEPISIQDFPPLAELMANDADQDSSLKKYTFNIRKAQDQATEESNLYLRKFLEGLEAQEEGRLPIVNLSDFDRYALQEGAKFLDFVSWNGSGPPSNHELRQRLFGDDVPTIDRTFPNLVARIRGEQTGSSIQTVSTSSGTQPQHPYQIEIDLSDLLRYLHQLNFSAPEVRFFESARDHFRDTNTTETVSWEQIVDFAHENTPSLVRDSASHHSSSLDKTLPTLGDIGDIVERFKSNHEPALEVHMIANS